jgi:hypothetical protein
MRPIATAPHAGSLWTTRRSAYRVPFALAPNESVVTTCTITPERHRPVRGDPPLPSRVAAAVIAGGEAARPSELGLSIGDRRVDRQDV